MIDHHARLRDLITAERYCHHDIEADRLERARADAMIRELRNIIAILRLDEDDILVAITSFEQLDAIFDMLAEAAPGVGSESRR